MIKGQRKGSRKRKKGCGGQRKGVEESGRWWSAVVVASLQHISINQSIPYRETPRFTPERIEVLQVLSKKPDVYERLARAIAPSIYENEDIKKGILLQLFGGTRKDFTEAGRGHFRLVVAGLGLIHNLCYL